jgi:uncharacterized Tic20 family protein
MGKDLIKFVISYLVFGCLALVVVLIAATIMTDIMPESTPIAFYYFLGFAVALPFVLLANWVFFNWID